MRVHIVLNGDPPQKIDVIDGEKLIAADGALSACERLNVKPDETVGDFDSYGKVPDGAFCYPTDKDFTDGEIALRRAKELGATEVVFHGFGGGREDHFLGNLALLEIADSMGIKAYAETLRSTIYFTSGTLKAKAPKNSTVSVIAVCDAQVSRSSGLKYPYNKTTLRRASTLGISNLTTEENFSLMLESGKAIVIVNKK